MSDAASLGCAWRLRPLSARSVTRAESSKPDEPTQKATVEGNSQKTRIDWLNVTFARPESMTERGLFDYLGCLIGRPIAAELDGGLFGFTHRWRMRAILDDGARVEIGSLAMGGESQRGRWLLSMNGKGCGLMSMNAWDELETLLWDLEDTDISRVDLALDFVDGSYTVDDAMTLYHDGAFISRGRQPDLDIQGAWHEGGTKGRTLYVGKLKNGKTLCVYEKGKQMGMQDSEWTRYEVRLGNRDRKIPLDVLTNPDRYFSGAYPALRGMLEGASEEIPTMKEEAKAGIAHGLYHLSRCYGKYINQVMEHSTCDIGELVQEIRVIGVPRKLDPGPMQKTGIDWDEVCYELRNLKQQRKGI